MPEIMAAMNPPLSWRRWAAPEALRYHRAAHPGLPEWRTGVRHEQYVPVSSQRLIV